MAIEMLEKQHKEIDVRILKCWISSIKMKRRLLPISLTAAALLLSACSTAPMVHDGQPSQQLHGPMPWNGPIPDRAGGVLGGLPGVPTAKATDASNIVTGGLRSGDGAISRNNIDAVLNNPERAASHPKDRLTVKPAEERPGLATGYGTTITSPWNRQTLVRASATPAGTDMVYYNDEDGIDAMSGYHYKISGLRRAAGEMLEWGIKGTFGYLPAYSGYNSKSFVQGRKNGNYSIVLKNRCKCRLEVVLSVDGLDVIDGKTASFSKRGYVIDPEQTLEIRGWRTSPATVARFQFSSVAGSYANLAHGETRNVGVIGLAVFGEKGVDPWTWMPDEVNVRNTASPFTKAPVQN
jgi:hypothetical protein